MLEPVTRRRVLLGALALPLVASGCTSGSDEPPTDPDRLALESALRVEAELLATVQGLGSGDAATQGVRAVEIHVSVLNEALSTSTSSPASPSASASASAAAGSPPASTSVDEAVHAADRAVDEHRRTLRSASPLISPVLAAIAASDAAVAALLRSGAA